MLPSICPWASHRHWGELFLEEKDRNKNLILSAGEAGGAHP